MAYYERDFYREEPETRHAAMRWPPLGRVGRVLLFLLPAVWVVAFFVSGEASPTPTGKLAEFLLSPHAILPQVNATPSPWQLLTAPLIAANPLALLLTCLLTCWLIGSVVEYSMGSLTYAVFLLTAILLGGVASALVDPLSGATFSTGFGAAEMAVFLAAAALAGELPGWLGLKYRTIVFLLAGLGLLLALLSYDLSEAGRTAPHMVSSLPGLATGALFGWFGTKLLVARGRIEGPVHRRKREHEFAEYARRFSVKEDNKGDDTRVREREEKRLRKTAQREADEQQAVDGLLDKIAKQGITSLSRGEKAFLERVSKRKKEASQK